MIRDFTNELKDFINRKPYPYLSIDDVLDLEFANLLQEELLNIDKSEFDRYNNPFEQKYTLRNKFNYPPLLNKLITYLESKEFISKIETVLGYELIKDETRNFHGVHLYDKNDYLDIHVDAGIHPSMKLKKQLTLGIYLSRNWTDINGCELEIWDGENSINVDAKISRCVDKIIPKFNRLVLFSNEDNSWHGNPEPVKNTDIESKRIFITVSYMSNKKNEYLNCRQKALFVARPTDEFNPEKNRLRLLRCDPDKYKDVYNINIYTK